MTKSRLMFLIVMTVVVAQALLAARYGYSFGGRIGFFDGGG